MADNLIQKKGESMWYVRLAIPADAQKAFGGRKVLIQSLRTGLRSEAMERRLKYLTQWKQAIAAARSARNLPDNWQADIADQAQRMDAFTRDLNRKLIGEKVELPPPDHDFIESAMASPLMRELAQYVIKTNTKGGLAGEMQENEFKNRFAKELLRHKLERDHALTNEERAERDALLANPASYKPRSPVTQKKLDKFRAWYTSQGRTLKTVDILVRKLEMFSAWLNQTGHPLSFDTVSQYLEGLKDGQGNALTSKTKKQHLWACNAFWKWAKKYDAEWREKFKDAQNPFDAHDLPNIKGEAKIYDAFTKIEVEALHAKALEKSDQNLANLIAVSAYTGCRLEEVGHIHISNCRFENDLPVSFKIPDAKTRAGIREVPVHAKLAPLMAKLFASSTDDFLLVGRPLDESNVYGLRLDSVGKRFGRMKMAAGFDSLHVFHSVRKTAITIVHQANARMEVMAGLFGHETGLITLDIYSTGPSMEQKRNVIELLDYTFDLNQPA